MDEFERHLAAVLDEIVPEPEHEIALDDVRALARPRLASARRRRRVAAYRRIPAARRRGHRLAILGAVAVAVIAAVGSYLLSRPADRTATTPPVSTRPAELTATAWQLTLITRPGRAPEAASAPVYFTFSDRGSTDHDGNAATTHIAPGRITFGVWFNDLLTDNAPGLDVAQSRFVYTLMQGTLTWSISGDTLTLDRTGAGSLTFRRSGYNQHPPHHGSVRGRFLAVGGPAPGAPRPMSGTGTVTFTNARTGQARTVDITAGRYETTLAPGRYTVVGHISGYESGRAGCAALRSVPVHVNRTAHIDVYCQER